MKVFRSFIGCLVVGVLMYSTTLYPLQLWLKLEAEASVSLQHNEPTPEHFVVKFPIAMPYASNWQEAKEAEGLLVRDGEFYTAIKKDFQNDTLSVYYIKNHNAREIYTMLSNYVKQQTIDDTTSETPVYDASLVLKWLKKDYSITKILRFEAENLRFIHEKKYISFYQLLVPQFSAFIELPPPKTET